MNLIEKVEHKGYTISVFSDDDTENPIEHWDCNVGTVALIDKYRHLGNEEYDGVGEDYIALPVYLYDHSGISVSTSPFNCQWDSGRVGAIYVDPKDYPEVTEDLLKKMMEETIEVLNQYVSGQVYYFSVKDKWGEEIDSCGGIYATVEEIITEQKGYIDDLPIQSILHPKALQIAATHYLCSADERSLHVLSVEDLEHFIATENFTVCEAYENWDSTAVKVEILELASAITEVL